MFSDIFLAMSSSDGERISKYIKVGLETTADVAKVVVETFNDEGDEEIRAEQLDKLRDAMTGFLKLEHEHKVGQAVLEKMFKYPDIALNTDGNIEEIIQSQYEQNLSLELSKSGLEAKDYKNDVRYLQLEGMIAGVETSQNSDIEEEEDLNDPWSRKPIKEPVRNRTCGHLYDIETVTRQLDRFSRLRKKLPCPVPDCSNDQVRRDHLVTDPSASERIRKRNISRK